MATCDLRGKNTVPEPAWGVFIFSHSTPLRAPYFVLGVTRQSTKHAVDELFSPYRARRRLIQPSKVMSSFNELQCIFFSITMRMMPVSVNYLQQKETTLLSIIRLNFVLYVGLLVSRGDSGFWTKCPGIFINTRKH